MLALGKRSDVLLLAHRSSVGGEFHLPARISVPPKRMPQPTEETMEKIEQPLPLAPPGPALQNCQKPGVIISNTRGSNKHRINKNLFLASFRRPASQLHSRTTK